MEEKEKVNISNDVTCWCIEWYGLIWYYEWMDSIKFMQLGLNKKWIPVCDPHLEANTLLHSIYKHTHTIIHFIIAIALNIISTKLHSNWGKEDYNGRSEEIIEGQGREPEDCGCCGREWREYVRLAMVSFKSHFSRHQKHSDSPLR